MSAFLLTSAHFCVLYRAVAKKLRKINVLLSETEYLRFEKYCEEKGFKKSTLLARLIREHLDSEHFAQQSEFEFSNQPQKQGRREAK
jgi:hypothetical protein